jgi:hypothetical protein
VVSRLRARRSYLEARRMRSSRQVWDVRKVAVIGLGHVGTLAAACLTEMMSERVGTLLATGSASREPAYEGTGW